MELSKRLAAVAGLVSYPTVADIGTDHGYVPVSLLLEGLLRRGLERGRKT